MPRTVVSLLIAVLFLVIGCTPESGGGLDKNKALVERFIELSNTAQWDHLAEIVAVDFARHSAATAGEPVRSLTDFIVLQQGFLATFPDQHVHLEDMIAEGDYVAIRARYSGTQTGPLGEFPATGKSIDSSFIAFFRIDSAKIAELWLEWDNVAILTQLGLFPPAKSPSVTTVERQHAEVWSSGNVSIIPEIYTEDFVGHAPGGRLISGHAGIRATVKDHREAFPDWHEQVDRVFVDGEFVISHFRSTGTHLGEFLGHTATGNDIEITETCIYRMVDGRIAEQWIYPDIASLQAQLLPSQ